MWGIKEVQCAKSKKAMVMNLMSQIGEFEENLKWGIQIVYCEIQMESRLRNLRSQMWELKCV